MLRLILPIAIGALLGGLLGWFGQCSSGTCPLTATWYRGAFFGALMGLLFATSPDPEYPMVRRAQDSAGVGQNASGGSGTNSQTQSETSTPSGL